MEILTNIFFNFIFPPTFLRTPSKLFTIGKIDTFYIISVSQISCQIYTVYQIFMYIVKYIKSMFGTSFRFHHNAIFSHSDESNLTIFHIHLRKV